ncbi:10958_t:CDS:2 [Acaulospora colombiana]|uniref:10958_t:CDS:1 n=1 Tax=Acaulospora colombiana TaxID=27376 RepID=A0ACA9KZH6_9GLOM|nr:10958_t:CDS:2 [Acaulospora colombiana]
MAFSLPEPVKSKLYVSRSTTNSPNSRHEKIITGHPFNHHLELLIPSPISPQQSKQFSNEILYYKAEMPLSYFIERSFVQNYVKSGRVIALSLGEGIDVEDVISLDNSGILTLNLTKDAYERLGLSGKPSEFGSKPQRFDSRESQEINFPPTFNAKRLTVDQGLEILSDISIPEMDSIKNMTREDRWRSDAVEIYDWIGLASLKAQR